MAIVKHKKRINLKMRILIPLTLTLAVLIGILVFILIYNIRHNELALNTKKKLESVQDLFEKLLSSEEILLSTTIEILSSNKQIQAAWLAKDRVELMKLTSPLLSKLRTRHRIIHFYFHDSNRVNFLRVDNPENHGDTINNFSMLEAEKSGRTSAGVELGQFSTYVVVSPWLINGRLVGYIELNEDIDHIIKKLHDLFGIELYLAINKKYLVREKWEEGMRMLGRKGKWDKFPSAVIVSQTMKSIPDVIGDFLPGRYHLIKNTVTSLKMPMEMVTSFERTIDDRLYYLDYIPIDDASERKIGGMVVMDDVTDKMDGIHSSILIISITCAIGAMVLFLLFAKILGLVEKQLEYSKLKLTEESHALEVVQKKLVRKERLAVLGQLTATVSHEIRNPLGTIRTAIFSINDAIKCNQMGRVDRALELAERNIMRCNMIIEELLDFSRIRKLDMKPTDIDSWLKTALLEQVIPEDIECTYELHAGIEVSIDREHFRRVIINVLNNAIQALQDEESPGNQLTLETAIVGQRLEIRAIDTGHGMPDHMIKDIFEPLFSNRAFGVGLGVPIIKDIMEKHSGGVEYQSEVGKGTTVILWLPITK